MYSLFIQETVLYVKEKGIHITKYEMTVSIGF